MNTQELVQAASHIAGALAGATVSQGMPLTTETIAKIVQESVQIVREIETQARRHP